MASDSHRNIVEVHQVGPHVIELEPPDIAHIHYDGDVELPHFQALNEILGRFVGASGVYLLRDARRGGLVTKSTREYVGKEANLARINLAITYGGSFQSRTVYQLMNAGAHRMRGQQPTAVFVETEAEARAWIANHRELGDDANCTET